MAHTSKESQEKTTEEARPGLLSIAASTLAAALGVQSSRNQQRDFKAGNIYHFILAGLIFTALFIGTITLIVRTVLTNSGL